MNHFIDNSTGFVSIEGPSNPLLCFSILGTWARTNLGFVLFFLTHFTEHDFCQFHPGCIQVYIPSFFHCYLYSIMYITTLSLLIFAELLSCFLILANVNDAMVCVGIHKCPFRLVFLCSSSLRIFWPYSLGRLHGWLGMATIMSKSEVQPEQNDSTIMQWS